MVGTVLPYAVFTLGDAKLHQIHGDEGKFFVMAEVAAELFQDTPSTFLQELRRGQYARVFSSSADVAATVRYLGLPEETSSQGITLLPSKCLEELLSDRRRMDLVQPLQLELMKLDSSEAVRLLGEGLPARALPLALDALHQGRSLFRPGLTPSLHLFPLHLLVAQAQLGVNNWKGAEESLDQATWLAEECEDETTPAMYSQLARLKGQLRTLQNRLEDATREFSAEVYYATLQFGVDDARTASGMHNLACSFEARGMHAEALRLCDHLSELLWKDLAKITLRNVRPTSASHGIGSGEPPVAPNGGAAAADPVPPLKPEQVSELLRVLQDVEQMYKEMGCTATTLEGRKSQETLTGTTESLSQANEGPIGAILARSLGYLYLHDVPAAVQALQEVVGDAVGHAEGDAEAGPGERVRNPELRSLIRKLKIAIGDEMDALVRVGVAAA